MTISVVGAYGRIYDSKAAVLVDWHKGVDFIIADVFHGADGKPTNKWDCQKMGEPVMIRYGKGLTKQVGGAI